ncbi:TonB-dependent receptor [Pseudoalteromonas luteoviolacea]|uniref:TonB-denpendent receptor n=1 Tax=Pseudoalteromonas luteoviolacea S4054 TaxID=1129367 RepID=A0A0F6AH38_9GAMM|nr:TonB-dependent receptor [Pseudoalteromonas luteoviolacea]AOT08853.1 hypothetical protein S4054249_13745 [Pseudoalteromonas luteoviolacea]AOT13766.1 hypothetical protein S40542_13715 [Pseudoalteromonas luteoviolacea]AOT18680.1 hypothetical protein S4054_13720 [Pseudoalteromonas luteoviolacea]KKE85463.1 hypothetical protein N479_25990 [Pseudoalteromonas luteoviolacea S4054]KZN67977.1 hypothetical protein N481_23340 [Pseudoalteromonas luteoviolacea S4047-1]
MKNAFKLSAVCLALSFTGYALADDNIKESKDDIEVIVVKSEFRPLPLMETANSVSVITTSKIEARSANFLSDMLATTPNLNYSAGASRGKFFQIRGIGELAEFQQVLRPSVGILIDGIDYSSLGGAATLFDVERVEILRGPQGTLFGANALAGMINVTTQQASEDFDAKLSGRFSDIDGNRGAIDTKEYGVVVNGALTESVNVRVAMQSNKSDGYIENHYLGKDDTNGIDEFTIRSKFSIDVNEDLNLNVNLVHLDFDNGYDAFTLDNVRDTVSDEPGTDDLESLGISLIADYKVADTLNLKTIVSSADSDSAYGFDLDWRSQSFCDNYPGTPSNCAFFGTRLFDRETQTHTFDTRLLSQSDSDSLSWVAGVYAKDEQQDLALKDRFFGMPVEFSRQFTSKNIALYGDISAPLTDSVNIQLGLRTERYTSDYSDSNDIVNDSSESLFGGHLSLDTQLSDEHFAYIRIAKGYKTGGVNVSTRDEIPLTYDTETLWNYEFGLKSVFSPQLHAQISVFYQDRKDAQVEQSFADCSGNSTCTGFTSYLINAAKANSYGIEAELFYRHSERLRFNASLGLMDSKFDEFYSYSHADSLRIARETGEYVVTDLSGKELSHAPSYQFTVSTSYDLTESVTLWLSLEAKDSFELGDNHDEVTQAYELLNAKVTWVPTDNLTLALFSKNLTNEDYIVRGFGTWDNDPRHGGEFDSYGPYYQFGNPREIGVEVSYRL